jgi:membrane protein
MKNKNRPGIFKLLMLTFKEFSADKAGKHSAALSYYTIFALAPFLTILISLVGLFYSRDVVQAKLFDQLNDMVGPTAASQIEEFIKNLNDEDASITGLIVGSITLLLGATGVFMQIQDSLNYIWSVKAKPKKGWVKLIINRLLSFSLIVSIGFLLMVSLTASAVMDLLKDNLEAYFSDALTQVFYVLNFIVVFIVIGFLFVLLFKVLPDCNISWKDAFVGAGFTAVLFLIGKFLIGVYLGNSKVNATYGAAASVIIILLWVYYSSLILYFGAEFTKVYSLTYGKGIQPSGHAVFIEKRETKELPRLNFKESIEDDNRLKKADAEIEDDASKKANLEIKNHPPA